VAPAPSWCSRPAAAIEGFIRSAAELGSPAMDEVLALAAAHGIEMTRPVG
jgi:hypothetical protein